VREIRTLETPVSERGSELPLPTSAGGHHSTEPCTAIPHRRYTQRMGEGLGMRHLRAIGGLVMLLTGGEAATAQEKFGSARAQCDRLKHKSKRHIC
jgi:hypothetical protein